MEFKSLRHLKGINCTTNLVATFILALAAAENKRKVRYGEA